MISTDVVADILAPVRERFVAEYPIRPEWRYWFKKDEFGDIELFVLIEIEEGITAEQIRTLKETVRDTLFENPQTAPYYPFIRFHAILPEGVLQ